ncbi:MAG TPA: IPT/TIG domain-containing protein [Thermoanaerobaculia bacterium]|nr:IPT/TIG domain-containing protein [Thermoanaerobaculia bacterium]
MHYFTTQHWISKACRLLPVLALAAVLGCTSSPTEPSSSGTPVTPKPPDPVISFTISVAASPSDITTGLTSSSAVTVDVRRADNGQPPPDGTEVTLSTTLGGFGSSGGPQSVTVQLVNGRAQATLFAGADAGTATIRAVFNGSAGATNVRIGAPATFFVSSVEPNVGNASGGEQVSILGGGFEGPVRVTFNGTAATVRSVSPNRIVVSTPSATAAGVPVGVGQTASVAVMVTINVNELDQASDLLERGYTYTLGGGGIDQPQVFTVNPASGTNDGGTRITIVGDGFRAPVQVLFGRGSTATSFNGVEARVESVTTNRIVAVTPAATGFGQNLTNQVVDLLVKNVDSGFSTVATQQFKYGTDVQITAIGPSGGPAAGGTRVLIQGQGFDDPLTVTFHFGATNLTVAQQVVSVSGTQIVILTGPAPLPVACPINGIVAVDSISVVNIQTGDGATADIGFNFVLPIPQITGVSPGTGGTGSTVTLSGENFGSRSEVIFGDPATGSSAQIQPGSSDTMLRVTVPNPPQGFTFDTQACGLNNAGVRNVPTIINITVRDLESRCLSTFRNSFLLIPADGTCVEPAPPPPPPPPAPPVANFTAQTINGLTVQFSDTSSGTPTSWAWDFGDGVTSTQRNPQHTYAAAQNYAVRLRATNAGGTGEVVKVIAVPTP